MVMEFAPTWLHQVSPLLHMTTLTTGRFVSCNMPHFEYLPLCVNAYVVYATANMVLFRFFDFRLRWSPVVGEWRKWERGSRTVSGPSKKNSLCARPCPPRISTAIQPVVGWTSARRPTAWNWRSARDKRQSSWSQARFLRLGESCFVDAIGKPSIYAAEQLIGQPATSRLGCPTACQHR